MERERPLKRDINSGSWGNGVTEEEIKKIDEEVEKIEEAVGLAEKSPYPPLEEITKDVYVEEDFAN